MSAADFLERAIEFLPVPDGPPYPEIRLHQASIAFELATKAAILHGGGTHADCLRARHDLVAGLDAARRYGFTATDAAEATARTLTPFYSSHRLDKLARDPGAADLERLYAVAVTQVAKVHAWIAASRCDVVACDAPKTHENRR